MIALLEFTLSILVVDAHFEAVQQNTSLPLMLRYMIQLLTARSLRLQNLQPLKCATF